MVEYIITDEQLEQMIIGEKASSSPRQSDRDKIIDEVLSILEKLYFWYDCEPQTSAEYEEGACSALEHAQTLIEGIRLGNNGE